MTSKGMLHAVFWVTYVIITILSLGFSSGLRLLPEDEDRQLYIVYMGSLPGGDYSPVAHHIRMLKSVTQNVLNYEEQVLVRSYKRSFNGFAAWLTHHDVEKLNAMEEVISVFPNVVYTPLTTRSWDFMGFPENVPRNPTVESDVIIGLIDTGIASNSSSFSDEGFGPIPKKWKGVCEVGPNVVCNKKVIGSKAYSYQAVDEVGHGTHTASIAAGNSVKGASFYDIAAGTARGAVPSARIAAYKVCSAMFGCDATNILSAFDDAIADGVDILSLSLGSNQPQPFGGPDVLVIGSYHALEKGILTVHAAGNDGPSYSSVSSSVPWLLSVGASTTDRQIIDKVVLGNGTSLTGRIINSFTPRGNRGVPLTYGQGSKSASCRESNLRSCDAGCLDPKTAKGKIVVCDSPQSAWEEVHSVGGVGVITQLQGFEVDSASVSPLPGVSLSPQEYGLVQAYVNSTTRPRATLLKSVAEKNPSAPTVASFSSRGPNRESPQINKPDLVAPGAEILAGFSPIASVSEHSFDHRSSKYNILSGTSMACPHVTGAAAYVKTFHPRWSPSAIKSALMTSARPMNASAQPDKEFAYGSGHIDPSKAVDPGLVYDLTLEDYKNYVCTIYGNSILGSLVGQNTTCPDKKAPVTSFNYPSLTFAIRLNQTKNINVSFDRVVTNVGLPNSTYTAKVTSDPNLKIQVVPGTLSFKSAIEKLAFTVKVTGKYPADVQILSSSLVWSDGIHVVRSPIVVFRH